jgi:hypothetical protein
MGPIMMPRLFHLYILEKITNDMTRGVATQPRRRSPQRKNVQKQRLNFTMMRGKKFASR